MPLKIVRNDITKMNTDAIVNTANSAVAVGEGIDTAVYNAAGYDELLALRKEIGEVPDGNAFITPGLNLPAKYIIHAVSPLYIDGESGEEEKLRNCYRNSLKLAASNGIKSIAFPLISTGSFGYPKADGFRIAMDECNAFLLNNELDVSIVVFDTKATRMAEKIYPKLEAYIDHNYVCMKREEEYGDAHFGSLSSSDGGYSEYQREHREMDARLMTPYLMNSMASMKAPAPMNAPTPIQPEIPKSSASKQSRFGQIFKKSESKKYIQECEPLCESVYDSDFDSDYGSDYDELEAFTGESELAKRMKHLADPFGRYMMYLAEQKGRTSVEIQDAAWITKKVYSKIKTHQDTYHPDKRTACQICVGLGLNQDEASDMLRRAGYSLSPCSEEDIIWKFFFTMDSEEYDIFDVSDALEKYGLKPIVVLEEKVAN